MTARTFAAIVGALLTLGALIALLIPVTIDDRGEALDCGNGFSSNAREIGYRDAGREIAQVQVFGVAEESTLEQQCGDALSTRRTWSWPVAGLGVVVLLGGLVIRPQQPTTPSAAPDSL